MTSSALTLGGIGGALLVVLLLALYSADVFAALLKPLEPLSRWFLRVFFGVTRPVVGPEALIGRTGVALSAFLLGSEPHVYSGRVQVASEAWSARCALPVSAGSSIRVVSVHGVFLTVEPHGI